jgi:hypothetical protein
MEMYSLLQPWCLGLSFLQGALAAGESGLGDAMTSPQVWQGDLGLDSTFPIFSVLGVLPLCPVQHSIEGQLPQSSSQAFASPVALVQARGTYL